MTPGPTLLSSVEALCTRVDALTDDPAIASEVGKLRDRLHSPVRVAIAGRAKAGKSTLLNALVGERLAETDSGECTRIVTWYREHHAYRVSASLRDGRTTPVDFDRHEGRLRIDLSTLDPHDVDRLDVGWPSSRLSRLTLVDTPGLGGSDLEASSRTRRLFSTELDTGLQVDAIVYLMRYLHQVDADFLEAFMERGLPHPSPANAVGVLSRADEIGAGRPDAMETVHRIAERYRADARVRELCSTVLPVAGLLAEASATLREAEGRAIGMLASIDQEQVADMLLSAERFKNAEPCPVSRDTRAILLDRLGVFGVRWAISLLQREAVPSVADLARRLRQVSGIDELVGEIERLFDSRAAALKARSALLNLKVLAHRLPADSQNATARLIADIERVEAGAHELMEMRLTNLLSTGEVSLSVEDQDEVLRLLSPGEPWVRLGLAGPDDHASDAIRRRVAHWRTRAADPLVGRTERDAYETLAHVYEAVFAEVGQVKDAN